MVIKKKSNGRWEYCIYLGLDERGKKKYKRKSGFLTKKDCLKEANKIRDNKEIKSPNKTFSDICALYLKDCELRMLRKSTLVTYKTSIDFLEKNFDQFNSDISEIKPDDIRDFIAHCYPITHNSFTRYIISRLKSIFKFAKNHNYINNDIFSNISLPPIYKGDKLIWSKSDLDEYIPMLEKYEYFDMIIFMLETGLRKGELCALTWECVDLKSGVIRINKSYVVADKLKYISPPKTKSSIRNIVLLKRSIDILEKRSVDKKSKYVFYDEKDPKKPFNPRRLYNTFTKFIDENNMKHITVHDLRHIHATLLLNNNIDYKLLSKRLGHTNVAFTLQTYTHVLPEREISLFKQMNNIF